MHFKTTETAKVSEKIKLIQEKTSYSGESVVYNIAKMTGYINVKYFEENKSLKNFKKI